MLWNCPHCNVALSVADDKLNTGWSYAKCYNCSEFAMVRKTATTQDGNPIQTEIRNTAASTNSAAQTPAVENKTPSPMVKPATVRRPNRTGVRSAATTTSRPLVVPPRFNADLLNPAPMPSTSQITEIPAASAPTSNPLNTNSLKTAPLPAFLLSDSPQINRDSRILRIIATAAGILAIASGIYLYIQGQRIWEKAKMASTVPTKAPSISERLARQDTVIATAITDQVTHQAMAPMRSNADAAPVASAQPAMWIRARKEGISLRAGPGLEHPVVGNAQPTTTYKVVEWKANWFRIEGNQNLWIRNDLVTPVQNPN